MAEVLEVQDEGHLRVLRLNRPERKNALNGELIEALVHNMRDAASDDDVWAVALTAAGSAFCSGLDLAEHGEAVDAADDGDEPTGSSDRDSGGDDGSDDGDGGEDVRLPMMMRVVCEKPIVAGINGVAVGAGVSVAMSADIRIAAPSARFHPGYARVGTSPDFGLTWTLLRAVGYERAMRFLLESRMVGAEEAQQVGMLSEVVASDDDLESRVMEYGTMLANVAPRASQQTKRLLVRIDQPPDLAAHLDTEIELALRGLSSEDGAEAIRAMMAKEPPNFTGR